MHSTATPSAELQSAMNLHRAGQLPEAEAGYRAILAREPTHALALHGLGLVHHMAGRNEQAIALLRQAVAASPGAAEFRSNLAAVLGRVGRHDHAAAELQQAVRIKPDYADAWCNLGVALEKSNRIKEAEPAFRRAIELKPQAAAAHHYLGNALRRAGRIAEAEACQREAVRLKPDYSGAWGSLAGTLADQGRLEEVVMCRRKVAELRPKSAAAGSALMSTLQYPASSTPAVLLAEARAWAERHAAALEAVPAAHDNDRDPDRRLRIGFVSGNLTAHPEGRFLRPLLANLDRGQFETTVYSASGRPDAVTATLRHLADRWREIRPHNDQRVAQKIRLDQIDILVDLTGHFGNNRMLLFARRPAPVQAIHFGYPGTTGMQAMGWRFTDEHADPISETAEGERAFYTSERLARVEKFAWCYEVPLEARSVGELPARANGYVTFLCANNTIKIVPEAVALWARILKAAPNSRLKVLAEGGKAKEPGEQKDRSRYLLEQFAGHGVDADRVELSPRRSRGKYFEWIHSADIALDPFPYNGGVTSCDTLYMGVPLVTLSGDSYWARQGAAILKNIGAASLIASSPEEYVEIAIGLAGDLDGLEEMRGGLRRGLMASPIADVAGFAERLGRSYRSIWKSWCEAKAGVSVSG
ncbi:MAG TPA: tetratricopeptide repeat protein [Tepidisphaeraceae bacterium]|jgi:predicted O-linked N-acetylglucosamine transferase (SPINDLY family)|nr:tetratricopeptide repeat protein [Tepidisphaeraceae bacterium]